jgi:cytoskeleton protein RodZ
MQSENQFAAGVDPHASPGVRLRTAREARGESVHEVAFAIKLSPRQVEALENDDFAALPGMAFVRGFARNYARYLGLDAAPLIAGIERLAGAGAPDLSPIRNAEGDLPAGGGGRQGQFPAGVIVVALLVLLGIGWYFDWFRTEPPLAELQVESAPVFAPAPVESTPAPPPVTGTVALPEPAAGPAAPTASDASPLAAPVAPPSLPPPAVTAPPAAAVAAPAAETPAAQTPAADAVVGADQLGFRFGADAWIEVRDSSGTILHAGTNRAGSSRVVQGKPPFRLIVGNSAKVVLEHDGKPVDLAPHTRGSVARLTLP